VTAAEGLEPQHRYQRRHDPNPQIPRQYGTRKPVLQPGVPNMPIPTYWLIDFAILGLAGLLAALLTTIVAIECSVILSRRGR
jgi:hypothetical protein